MYIDQQLCTGCGNCIPYCPVGAIKEGGGAFAIELDECVECTSCVRFAGCPTGAIQESPETALWPRSLRRLLSDPSAAKTASKPFGRGSGIEKVNDVEGTVGRSRANVCLEFGRPGVATRLSDVEKLSMALAKVGVSHQASTPISTLLSNPETGELKPEVRNERVLSAFLEINVPMDRLLEIVPVVLQTARQLDTVISWGMTIRLNPDGTVPDLEALRSLGVEPSPYSKVNLGMGRPLVGD